METFTFKDQDYKVVDEQYGWTEEGEFPVSKFINQSKPGECMNYHLKVIFHTDNGFVSAWRDNLDNYCNI